MATIDFASRVEEIKAAIRKRHKLSDDTPVGVKAIPATVDVDNVDPYKFTARITKNVADRDDEVVLPSGGMFSEFDTSGAVFWNHNYDKPVAIPGPLSKSNDEVIAKAVFLKRPDDFKGEWFPDFVRAFVTQMRAAGKSPGVSIGFIPLESRKPTAKDRKDYGDRIRNVITRWKMLEWSIAPVQSNPESYVLAVGKSIGKEACKALFGMEPPAEMTQEEREAMIAEAARKAAEMRRKQQMLSRKALEIGLRVARQRRAQDIVRRMAVDIAEARIRGGVWV